MTTQALLKQTTLFGSLTAPDLDALAAVCRLRRFAQGTTLFLADDPGDTLFVLRSGQVKVVLETSAADHILCLYGPGDTLGELSVIDGKPRSATIIAIEPVVAYTLSRPELLALIARRPTIGIALMSRMAGMVRRVNEHVQDFLSLDAAGRIAKRLLELAEGHGQEEEDGLGVTVQLTQRELGQMVAVSTEKTNRVLQQFERRGILTTCRRRITIRRPDLLPQLAS